MHNSKLLKLIAGLQSKEIHWLQKFLASPFYNTNKELIDLFQYIKKYYPSLATPKLSKEMTFKKLYPNEKFDPQKMRKAMYSLASLVEEFLVAQQLKNKPFEKKKTLLKALSDRNIYEQFQKQTKEMIADLDALPYRDTIYCKEIFELNFNYSKHTETDKQVLNAEVLKRAAEHLDAFYALQKQQLDFAVKSHEKLFKSKVKLASLKQVKTTLEEYPIYQVYQLIIQSFSNPDDAELYSTIESLLKNEISRLGRDDKNLVLRILLNHSSAQINKGLDLYFSRMLSLYKFGLEEELLIENNLISETTFTNIVTVGSHEKDFEWVEGFIQKYKSKLPISVQEDATCFGLGLMFYQKKDYAKTIDLILNHSFSKPLHILQSKTILLRAYFDQYLQDDSYYELLIAQANAFEKFIRRNDLISKVKKEGYLNFVLFARKIINGHWQNKLDRDLYEKLKNTEPVLLKFWLLEILDRS